MFLIDPSPKQDMADHSLPTWSLDLIRNEVNALRNPVDNIKNGGFSGTGEHDLTQPPARQADTAHYNKSARLQTQLGSARDTELSSALHDVIHHCTFTHVGFLGFLNALVDPVSWAQSLTTSGTAPSPSEHRAHLQSNHCKPTAASDP